MKNLKVGGLQELQSFKNRLSREYGRGAITREEFVELAEKVENLIEQVELIELQEGEGNGKR